MIIIVAMVLLAGYAYVELYADRIAEEMQIRRLIRKSWEDARHVCRNPIGTGYAGWHPERRRWHGHR